MLRKGLVMDLLIDQNAESSFSVLLFSSGNVRLVKKGDPQSAKWNRSLIKTKLFYFLETAKMFMKGVFKQQNLMYN